MLVRRADAAEPFTTMDGSTIREVLNVTDPPTRNQSLAEATVQAGARTRRHLHRRSEEIYLVLEGTGRMEVDGTERDVRAGDAILIPPGAWHAVTCTSAGPLRFLCMCAPAYAHADTVLDAG